MMAGRTSHVPIALTRDETGTDVNFGTLTKKLIAQLKTKDVDVHYQHEVQDLAQLDNGAWLVTIKDLATNHITTYESRFCLYRRRWCQLAIITKDWN